MPAVYELLTACHDFAGNFIQNVFHYQLTEAGTATPYEYAKALANKWFASPTFTDFLALLGGDVVVDFITARKITGGGGPSATVIVNAVGTGGANSVCSAVAADVAWQAANATNRPGHTFISSFPDGALQSGTWQNAFAGNVTTWIGDMLAVLTLAGALGTATFGHFTRKTQAFDAQKSGELKPKPTALNKRTLPII